MNIGGHDIGVCSWSFRANTVAEAVAGVKSLGLGHVQLALSPLAVLDDTRKQQQIDDLRASGLAVTAGMFGFPGEDYSSIPTIRQTGGFVPDALWPARLHHSTEVAKLAEELSIALVTTHIGFVPHKGAVNYQTMLDRTRAVADTFGPSGLTLLLETGQESAHDLLAFLEELARPNVAVNFDPANMILYGAGDPIDAIAHLGSRIRHVHVKDAIASTQPGIEWGKEVVFGQGQVNPKAFIKALHSIGYAGPLVIEREAGENHADDVRAAIEALRASL